MKNYRRAINYAHHPFDPLKNDRVSVKIAEYLLFPNPDIRAEVMKVVSRQIAEHDLGSCSKFEHKSVGNLINLYLEDCPEKLTKENIRELREIVNKENNRLVLQYEPPKASKPYRKPTSTKSKTSVLSPTQLSLISSDFTPSEKQEIENFTKSMKGLSVAQLAAEIASSNRIRRSAAIRVNALLRANGICESCDSPAPFETPDGPYLEGHHIERLADGGADSMDNVIALCPNCHRKAHYSIQKDEFKTELKKNLDFIRIARNSLMA